MPRKHPRFLVFISLLLLTLGSSAQTPKFLLLQDADQNQADPCELVTQSSVVIDPVTGNITATVSDLDECLGTTDALNVSPLLTTPQPVVAGTNLTVLWASVGALSCQPDSALTNSVPGWTSQSIGLEGPRSFTVSGSATAGTYNLGVSCTDGELAIARSTQVQVTEPDLGDPPPAPALTVNSATSTSIEPGQALNVAWSSSSATACQASGSFPGWSGSKNTSGTLNISNTGSLTIGQNYSVGLTCSNAAGNSPTVTRTVTIIDPDDPPPTACEGRPLFGQGALANWNRKTTGQNSCAWRLPPFTGLDTETDCRFFADVFSGAWPGPDNSANLTVFSSSGREFISMEFNSGNIPADHVTGRITQEVPQFAGAQAGNKMWSISQCPGDFNKSLIDTEMGPGCIKRDQFGVTEAFNYGGANSFSVTNRCALQPNKTYYLNIVWTNDQAGTPPADIQPNPVCVGQRCGGIFAPAGQY